MVQQFREQEVRQSGQVPGYQNVNYSPDAFGASVARALQAAGQDIRQFGADISAVEKEKKANDALVVRNQANDALRESLFNPQTGIYTKQGGNAMEAQKELNTALDTIQKNYIDKVEDPETKRALERMWLRETDQAKDNVARFQLSELGKYKEQTTKATMLGAMEDGYNNYNNDKAVDDAIKRADEAIMVNSAGLPPEALAGARAESKSSIRLAAISRWAAEDPGKALEYYQAHKDDLSGKDHITATQFVNTARKSQRAQQFVAGVINSGNKDFFRSNIVPAESSNNPKAVSDKNALGLSQIRPATARAMAKKIGRTDIAALPEAELKKKLLEDEELNITLGSTYWNEQLENFGGDVEAALVAYNAGPEAAKAFLSHNAGNPPGQRDYDVPGWKGVKTESEGYVKKVLGGLKTNAVPANQRMTKDNWSLKNFKPEDLIAPTPGGAWVDARSAVALDGVVDTMKKNFRGFQIKINEEHIPGGTTAGRRRGTADPADNPHVKKSQHLKGTAFDIQVQTWTDEQKAAFIVEARKAGFKGFGFYGPNGHLHIDMGAERTWGRVPYWARDGLKTKVDPTVATQETQTRPSFTGPGANDTSGYFINNKTDDLDQWLMIAEQSADPDIVDDVKSILRIEAGRRKQQRETEEAVNKQQAWDAVLNGGSTKDFSPELLSRLTPEFVNTLRTFESKRDNNDLKTDWNAYAQLQAMSDEEFVRTDIMTEYGTRLADAERKGELIRQRETRKKLEGQEHDSALLAGTRTRTQIVNDVQNEQGWKENDPRIGQLNRRLDDLIKGQAQIKGKPLDATEIQDIVDKLLIEDVGPQRKNMFGTQSTMDFWKGTQGRAMGVQDPDTFVAAAEWQDVQQDDQKVLLDYYQRQFGDLPDEEQATDLYNRAMRVWLGGKADGPDDERRALRSALEKMSGAAISDERFERAYAEYLLSYIRPRR